MYTFLFKTIHFNVLNTNLVLYLKFYHINTLHY